jgi:hypothetical protein
VAPLAVPVEDAAEDGVVLATESLKRKSTTKKIHEKLREKPLQSTDTRN